MNDPLARVTSIGRAIDVRYASNRYILVASMLLAAAAGAVTLVVGDTLAAAARAALLAGLAAFAAWALAREIDPDTTASAALAAPLAVLSLLVGEPFLGAVFAVLLAGRIVGRTTGLPLRPTDGVLVVGLAVYVAAAPFGVVAVGGLALAAALDAALDAQPGWRRWLAPTVIGAGGTAAVVAGEWPGWTTPGIGALALVLAAVVGTLAMRRGALTSTCDHTGEPIDPVRLRFTRVITLVVPLAYGVIGGEAAIAGLAPVFAAFAGAGIAAIGIRARSGRTNGAVAAGTSAGR